MRKLEGMEHEPLVKGHWTVSAGARSQTQIDAPAELRVTDGLHCLPRQIGLTPQQPPKGPEPLSLQLFGITKDWQIEPPSKPCFFYSLRPTA